MEKKEFIYMMEKMNEVRLFSRSLIIHSTIKNKRTAQEYDLLSQLVLHNEGMTPANLSKAMYLNKTIVSRLVDKLNKDGYVTKKQDEYDKRSYSVFITEYGKEELFKIYELYLSPINELRLKLGDEEFFNLISCIEKANKIIFITRRNDIVPPVVKLNPDQALEAFMLGESIETSAGDPTKAGQSKRCVGTNPFIMGPEIEEGLRLKEILQNNPDMECYILNTGSVGAKGDFKGEKLSIKVSTTIMKEIARDTINWVEDEEWGYEVPVQVNGIDIEKYNPRNYYTEEEYKVLASRLKAERKAWLAKYELAQSTRSESK